MNPATSQVNNALDKIRTTIAVIILSDFDLLSKHSDITASAAPGLNNYITVVFRNRADAVLFTLDVALLQSWSKLIRVFSICVCAST